MTPGGDGWAAQSARPEEAWAGPLRQRPRLVHARPVRPLRRGAAGHGRGRAASRTCRSSSTSTAPRAAAASRSRSASASSSRPTPGCPACSPARDHYLGDMTLDTITDLYFINAFMDAVHDRRPAADLAGVRGGLRRLRRRRRRSSTTRRPSTSRRGSASPRATALINYYLFAGGINPPLDEPVGDGNDRISFTGERHGTAAPVGPEGQRGIDVRRDGRTVHAVRRQRALAGRHGRGARRRRSSASSSTPTPPSTTTPAAR